MSKILSDIGENYEYARVIIENTIELKKIEALEKSSDVISSVILTLVISFLMLMASMVLISIFIFWIAGITSSLVIGLFSGLGLLTFLAIFVYVLRERIIYGPITKALYHKIEKVI